jgi:hypothetical protein
MRMPSKPLLTFFVIASLATVLLVIKISLVNSMGYVNEPHPHYRILGPRDYTPVEVAQLDNWSDTRSASNTFVGIALSGGGSRAAVFGAAVLRSLKEVGILQQAHAISGVSGGSIPVAYYGLFRDSPNFWETLVDRMAADFRLKLVKQFLIPANFIAVSLSPLDRSDLLADVLNDQLFGSKTFRNLISKLPRIFIGATSMRSGALFTFTEEDFLGRVDSRLDTFPIATAVAASSAYPGLLDSVTLRDYSPTSLVVRPTSIKSLRLIRRILSDSDSVSVYIRGLLSPKQIHELEMATEEDSFSKIYNIVLDRVIENREFYDEKRFAGISLSPLTRKALKHPEEYSFTHVNRLLFQDSYPNELDIGPPPERYYHLIDGGVVDNQGITALVRAYDNYSPLQRTGKREKACLLIAVDAYVEPDLEVSYTADPRRFYDLLIDSNAVTAANFLFEAKRKMAFKDMKVDPNEIISKMEMTLYEDTKHKAQCMLWHIDLARIQRIASSPMHTDERERRFYKRLSKLVSVIETDLRLNGGSCPEEQLKNALEKAAELLVTTERLVSDVRKWLERRSMLLPSFVTKSPTYPDINANCALRDRYTWGEIGPAD